MVKFTSMKKICNTIILVFITQFIYSQNQAYNWFFGDHVGMTFSTNPPSIITGGQLNTSEGCASISDTNGNLLFYTDGITVWNSTHSVMLNGTGLLGNSSSTQSALIIPSPGNSTMYYLITAPVNTSNNPLAYSIIDLTVNNGLGALIVKNTPLLASSTEKQTAVYHSNGSDVWIIAHEKNNNVFKVFLLTSTSISLTPVTSTLGNITYGGVGQLKASPCGNQIAMVNYEDVNLPSILELFDFNNSTGVVSNPQLIRQWTVYNGAYGVEFSPDNSKLYASIISPALVVQFDLLAGSQTAITSSEDTIGISPNNNNGSLQLGPDGNIYLSKRFDSTIACIKNPNQPSDSVVYIEHFLAYGNFGGTLGLPAFVTSLFCNIPSGISSISNVNNFTVYPNPFDDNISILTDNQNLKNANFSVKNVFGQTVFEKREDNLNHNPTKTIDLSFLASGIYLLEIDTEGERTVKKIIKE